MRAFPEKFPSPKEIFPPLDHGISQGIEWLKKNQNKKGFWVGTLESNSCMEAQWILAQHVLGVQNDSKYEGVVQAILKEQRPDGSWEVYFGAKGGDCNTTVECYAALRVAGHDPQSEVLRKARIWILNHHALYNLRNFTKYWLALIGEWPWEHLPSLPPEIIFLPKWMPFNIYQFASWVRGTIIPLCILSARRRVQALPSHQKLDELYPQGRENFDYRLRRRKSWFSWEGIFFALDKMMESYHRFSIKPAREWAIKACLEWIIKHQEADGAWSGIQPPWIYSLMALHTEGYSLNHPVVAGGLDAFNKHWKVERGTCIYLQASESPVWDTVLTLLALLDCGENVENNPSILPAIQWVLREQITTWGDWQEVVKGIPSGGWAFEFENDLYPDVDDTSVALIVVQRLQHALSETLEVRKAISLGMNWMLGMQCKNGGWAAFDRDNDNKILTKIPFADFGELLDPPSVDVTAHVLEALSISGKRIGDPIIDKALHYIKQEQEDDGSWFGRWGCNHIYGTAAVLPALSAIGESMTSPYIRKAAAWITSHQNSDGGWGESCASYMERSMRGIGTSTASQTGWALMALLAVNSTDYLNSIQRGVHYLLSRQKKNGTWDEPEYTGTGFPGYGVGERIPLGSNTETELGQSSNLEHAFMINYNLYRHYFPMMALGRARQYLRQKLLFYKDQCRTARNISLQKNT